MTCILYQRLTIYTIFYFSAVFLALDLFRYAKKIDQIYMQHIYVTLGGFHYSCGKHRHASLFSHNWVRVAQRYYLCGNAKIKTEL